MVVVAVAAPAVIAVTALAAGDSIAGASRADFASSRGIVSRVRTDRPPRPLAARADERTARNETAAATVPATLTLAGDSTQTTVAGAARVVAIRSAAPSTARAPPDLTTT